MSARRRELAQEIYRRVSKRVRRATPTGTGHWPPTWRLVEGPSRRFLDAVDAWIDVSTDRTKTRVQEAADELVETWRRVGWLFEAAAEDELTAESVRAPEPGEPTASTTGGER